MEDADAVPTLILEEYATDEDPFRPSEVRYDARQGEIAKPVYISEAGQEIITEDVAVEIVKVDEFVLP